MRRVDGVKYMLVDKPEYIDMAPIYDIVDKALAQSKGSRGNPSWLPVRRLALRLTQSRHRGLLLKKKHVDANPRAKRIDGGKSMARSTANFWDKKTPYETGSNRRARRFIAVITSKTAARVELGYWRGARVRRGVYSARRSGRRDRRLRHGNSAGKTLPSFRVAVDEVVYVFRGRGVASIWAGDRAKKIFEWQSHAMFLIPGNYYCQLSNMQGDQSVKLLHCSYLPLAMSVLPDPDYFFNNPLVDYDLLYGQERARGLFRSQSRDSERARHRARRTQYLVRQFLRRHDERGIGSIISSGAAPAAMSCGWDFPARRSRRICRFFPRAPTRKATAMVPAI